MHYIRHYSVYPYDDSLKRRLEEEWGIECITLYKGLTQEPNLLIFDIDESDPRSNEILAIVPPITPPMEGSFTSPLPSRYCNCLYFPQYSEEERKSAKWLMMDPITQKVEPRNVETMFAITCVVGKTKTGLDLGRHRVQIEPYMTTKNIKFGNSQFFYGNYMHDSHIFCDDRARQIIENAGLRGVCFENVLKWKTREPLPNMYQIMPENIVPDGVLVGDREIEEYTCEICGMTILRMTGGRAKYGILADKLDPDIDFYQTLPIAAGRQDVPPYIAGTMIIISQRAYQVFAEKKMKRAVRFTPLRDMSTK